MIRCREYWLDRAAARRYSSTVARRPTGLELDLLKVLLQIRFTMATCPQCGVSSREDPTAMTIEPFLQAKPIGTWSLSGRAMKMVAVTKAKLTCRCGWSVTGQLEDGHLIADPPDDLQ